VVAAAASADAADAAGGTAGTDDGDAAYDSRFHRALFRLLLRYKSIRGSGFQAAIGPACFEALKADFGVDMECFASPLNCRYGCFCSAFPDTDRAFGGAGSFFAFRPAEGSFEANPPFENSLVAAMAQHLDALLDAATGPLSFVIIVGASAGARGSPAWKLLTGGRFLTASMDVKLQQHGYFEGDQHMRDDGGAGEAAGGAGGLTRMSSCDTAVFWWQNASGRPTGPATDAKLLRLRAAFAATKPQYVPKGGTGAGRKAGGGGGGGGGGGSRKGKGRGKGKGKGKGSGCR
jgi:hypothetical protein